MNSAYIDAALFTPSETTEREHQERPPNASPNYHPLQSLSQGSVHTPHLYPEAHPLHGSVLVAMHLPAEVEAEMAVAQVSAVSFKDLIQVPN